MKVWSGRFQQDTNELMENFSTSIHFDQKLFEADIKVNKAWARALVDVDVYTREEAARVIETLDRLQAEYRQGLLEFSKQDEDIHSANERWLTERLDDLGARIHTGRSRNDQVVTDLKIYLREQLKHLKSAAHDLLSNIYKVANNHVYTVMPGFTHLRQAQPVSFAHYLLSFFFQLERDLGRINECHKRMNKLPLGSGAIAGTAFPIDRYKLAKELGFEGVTDNSIDATSDRDYVIEALMICCQFMLHQSRLAEDFIILSSEQYGFIQIDQAYSTGSSMMPQKRNPDSLELIRGKTGRMIGHLNTLMIMMKSIPTAYVRDLQEDKEPLFNALEQTGQSLLIFAGVIQSLKVNKERMQSALDPALYATDVADYLVKKGLPFRQAHALVAQIVTFAESRNTLLSDLTFEEFRNFSDLFDHDILYLFDARTSISKRNLPGGTGPKSVEDQLLKAKQILNTITE